MRLCGAAALVVAVMLLPAGAASAHPLDNCTVNTCIGMRVQPDQTFLDLVIDMAEIPTVQARRSIDTDGDSKVSDDEASA